MAYVKKRDAGDFDNAGVAVPPVDEAFTKAHPALWEFLTLTRWEDGSPRETGTLFIFVEDGGLKVAVNDREGGLVAFLTSKTFKGLLEAVEKGIREDRLDWRRSRVQAKGRGKRT